MKVFLGVDQTGASKKGGREALPLSCCIGVWRGNQLRVVTAGNLKKPLTLSRFQPEEIEKILVSLEINQNIQSLLILVDCVLGLPNALLPPKGMPYLWEYFERAAQFSLGGKEFGRDVAEAFFDALLTSETESYPRRLCEILSGSNSVFQKRPFQKNIQTGTFRIWKDLGQTKKEWARIWPFDLEKSPQQGPWIFEGYPSLIWKNLLGSRTRDLKKLRKLVQDLPISLKIDTWKWIESDPNQADAFVLMLGGFLLEKRNQLWSPHPEFMKQPEPFQEGWILGLDLKRQD